MLPLIEELLALECHHSRASLASMVLSGSHDRSEETSRRVALVFENGVPLYVARWYAANNARMEAEVDVMRELAASGAAAARPLFAKLIEVRGERVLISVEEYLEGFDLETLVDRRQLSVDDAIRAAERAWRNLSDSTRQLSSVDAFREELDGLLRLAREYSLFPEAIAFWAALPDRLVQRRIAQLSVTSSIVHGDFTLRNIVLCQGRVSFFDCEFSRRSHLAELDWFRLWRHSAALATERIDAHPVPGDIVELLGSPDDLRDTLLLAVLDNFQKKLDVFPDYAVRSLVERTRKELVETASEDHLLLRARDPFANAFDRHLRELSVGFPSAARHSLSEFANSQQAIKILGEDAALFSSEDIALFERRYSTLIADYQAAHHASKHAKDLLSAEQDKVRGLRKEAQRLHAEVHARQEEIEGLNARLFQQQDQHQQVVNSASFRLGKMITTTAKRVPGASQLKTALKRN